MVIGGPYKSAISNCTSADRIAGAGTQHACRGRVFSCYAKRRAPCDEFAVATWYHQPCSRSDIWICKIANGGWIQIIPWEVDDILWFYPVIGCNAIQTFSLLPFVIRSIYGQDS